MDSAALPGTSQTASPLPLITPQRADPQTLVWVARMNTLTLEQVTMAEVKAYVDAHPEFLQWIAASRAQAMQVVPPPSA